MGEKAPDTDRSGIERRDILKGLGFGAMGLAGVGTMSGGAVAVHHDDIVNVGFTPPGEDLEDDEITGTPPELNPEDTDSTFDLVAKVNMGPPSETRMIGKSWTVLSEGTDQMQVTRAVFEEGTASASVGEVKADSDGMMEIRQNFSVGGLRSGEYILVLSCVDYTDLWNQDPVDSGTHQGTYEFNICDGEMIGDGMTVAHGFSVQE